MKEKKVPESTGGISNIPLGLNEAPRAAEFQPQLVSAPLPLDNRASELELENQKLRAELVQYQTAQINPLDPLGIWAKLGIIVHPFSAELKAVGKDLQLNGRGPIAGTVEIFGNGKKIGQFLIPGTGEFSVPISPKHIDELEVHFANIVQKYDVKSVIPLGLKGREIISVV